MEKLHIPENLYKQFLCGKYCDLQIQVESSYFRAHSCVVAASSWVLEAILQSSTSEDGNLSKLSIQLHGVTAYAISCLLGFIYAGKFPSETYADEEKRREVLHAAKLYKMEEVPREFEIAPPASKNGAMSNLQILESGSLDDSLLENLVSSQSPEKASSSLSAQKPIEMNVIMSDDNFSSIGEEQPSSEEEKLADDVVKDHVTKNVEFAQKHGILYCIFCSEIFTTQTGLIAHMSEHKPGYRKSSERAAAAMATFVIDEDPLLDYYSYDYDYGSTPSKKKRGAPKKAFTCAECGMTYSGKVYLLKHYRSRHPGSLYCKYCAERFDTADLLRTHMLTHGPAIEPQDNEAGTVAEGAKKTKAKKGGKTHNCNLCSTSFLKRRELVQHQQNLHGIVKPMHICTTCGKEFKEKASLRSHTRVHTGEKPYVCSFCGNCFADAKTWKDHERRHRGEKPFLCTTCGKSFTYRQSFTRHMKFHEGKRPFQCAFCGKAFVLRQNLKEHERRHNK